MPIFESIECANCTIVFGVSPSFNIRRKQDQQLFWCPNGHSQVYSESETDRLRKSLALKDQELGRKQDEINRLRNQLNPSPQKQKRGRPRKEP
jgi:hypothetical protein